MAQSQVNQGENITSLSASLKTNHATQELLERDAKVYYHQTLSTPVFNAIQQVDGAYIVDGQGEKHLDLHGNGVHTIGYNNPKVLQAIQDAISNKLTFAPRRFTNEPAVALAEKLTSMAPKGLNRVLFCPGGSEAVEMATMLAKHHTGKWKTLSYYGTFHGAGFQSISIGADGHFREGLGPMMPGAIHLELPDYYRNPWGWTNQEAIDNEYIRQFELQVLNNPDIAALISEPIFYNSTVPTKYYWERIQEICREHGILLIFDEIYTAFGRTGKFFASEHFVTPDILVVGKGFGGGVLPYAGIIGKEELNTLHHRSIGHYTHEKNPLCAAVGKAVIDYVEEESLVSKTAELGLYMKAQLEEMQNEFQLIGNIEGLGLNIGVDLVKNRNTKERAKEEATELMKYCLSKNVSFKLIQGNILNLKPSLVITKNEIDYVLTTIRNGLSEITTKFN